MRARNAWGPGARVGSSVLFLVVAVGACGVRGAPRDGTAALAPYAGREVESVRFVGAGPFSADTLAGVIETTPSTCTFLGLPICIPFTSVGERTYRLDLEVLERDVRRLELFYRRSGYFGTRVVPAVEPMADDDGVEVTFVIAPGDPVYLDSLGLAGLDGILDTAEVRRRLPLEAGDIFDLGAFAAASDTVRRRLLARGHAYADVLRAYDVDTLLDRATASLTAVPGPIVVVDSILVRGADQLGRRTVLRQLTFRTGDVLVVEQLAESQRNLYTLDIVQLAAVSIAPDSLQLEPRDSATATVLVQIAEGPVHVVEASVGYGSVDCFRSQVNWVSRSFGGGARRLALIAGVSKIGIGDPLDAGFGGSICRAFEDDPFGDELDYQFSADLTQPWFLSPRFSLGLNLFADRLSEPRVFQREAAGGRLAVVRRFGLRDALTASLGVERARTRASPAVFCAALLVCEPDDIAALSRPRREHAIGLGWVRNRTDVVVDPSRGYVVGLDLITAERWLGSDVDFVRGTSDGVVYATSGAGWTWAGRLRLGSFFGTASFEPGGDFIPPDDRFYAGGSNSVRGFARNELGPGVYVEEGPVFDPDAVEFVPIGGTSVAVSQLELRTPGFARGNTLRLAFFVDAGAVTRERHRLLAGGEWRVTPGAGLRIRTPIGPVRVDVAYNPYAPISAPLFLTEPETGTLVRVADDFAPPRPGFLSRFRVHLAVGEPF